MCPIELDQANTDVGFDIVLAHGNSVATRLAVTRPTTAAELFLRNADRDDTAACFEAASFTFAELATESLRRAALWDEMRDPAKPPHIGVLLDNTPEYLFWLGAAAISRSVVVGINATYRGAELARLIDHSECQLLVTSDAYAAVLADAPSRVSPDRVLETQTDAYAGLLRARRRRPHLGAGRPERCLPADLHVRIDRVPEGGAVHAGPVRDDRPGRCCRSADSDRARRCTRRCPCSTAARSSRGWRARSTRGVPFGTRSRFSASSTMPDIRRTGATMLAYTGKVLNYILATPPSPDDENRRSSSRSATRRPRPTSERSPERFGCKVRDSYGSTEGMIIIRRDASMPQGALGTADDDIAVYDPETGQQCPPRAVRRRRPPPQRRRSGRRDRQHRRRARFEGYYQNEEALAAKVRDGIYWSGDLAYRDADGWFYFAGRSNEWLRVDGENFAAAPVERIVARLPGVRSVAVYAVPDERVGDRVMVAIEVADLTPSTSTSSTRSSPSSPTSARSGCPSFVRVDARAAEAGEHEDGQDPPPP